MIRRHKIVVTPAGEAGAATGNTTSTAPINGRLWAVNVTFAASSHANTDTTIATTTAPTTTIITLTDTNTSGWYYPRHQAHSNAGAALTLDGTRTLVDKLVLDDYVKVTVAQGTADKTVTVTLLVEE